MVGLFGRSNFWHGLVLLLTWVWGLSDAGKDVIGLK